MWECSYMKFNAWNQFLEVCICIGRQTTNTEVESSLSGSAAVLAGTNWSLLACMWTVNVWSAIRKFPLGPALCDWGKNPWMCDSMSNDLADTGRQVYCSFAVWKQIDMGWFKLIIHQSSLYVICNSLWYFYIDCIISFWSIYIFTKFLISNLNGNL